MTGDIDNMTETQIDAGIRSLDERARIGQMTPSEARRLERLRRGAKMIRSAKRSRYWL